MKIAVSSDLHLDLNHADVSEIITQQAHYLTRQEIDHYFSVGDSFNDFAQTSVYFAELQSQLPITKVHYLAGNHDMLKGVTKWKRAYWVNRPIMQPMNDPERMAIILHQVEENLK